MCVCNIKHVERQKGNKSFNVEVTSPFPTASPLKKYHTLKNHPQKSTRIKHEKPHIYFTNRRQLHKIKTRNWQNSLILKKQKLIRHFLNTYLLF